MEEDIKILEEFIEYSQEMINDMEYERPVDVTIYQTQVTAIENLIKRNRELEEERKMFYRGNVYTANQLKNSIPKSKVKEKNRRIKQERKRRTKRVKRSRQILCKTDVYV